MYLRREGEVFYHYFLDRHGYDANEAALIPAEFVRPDGVFDTVKWQTFVTNVKKKWDSEVEAPRKAITPTTES